MAKLKCPKCRSANVVLLDDTKNMDIHTETDYGFIPFLMPSKTRVVKKEKRDPGKVALAMMTGGVSAMFIGTKSKKHNEYLCRDCGKRWVGK